jgi:hypothetical protein
MPFTDEKATLIGILRTIQRILGRVAHEHIRADRDLFISAWEKEVGPTFDSLIREIEAIPSEENSLWRRLRDHGFSGEQLRLKATRFRAVLEKGVLGKILDIINTILSSIPGADPVREYKEIMEGAVETLDAVIKP